MFKFITTSLLCIVFVMPAAQAEEAKDKKMPVSVETQISMFARILRYEENLKTRVQNDSLVVGIVYQGNFAQSIFVKEEVVAAFRALTKVGNYEKVGFVPIRMSTAENIVREIDHNNINVLYVAPLEKADVEEIARASRSRKTLTFTGMPEYLEDGLAVSLEMNKMNIPMILFNLPVVDAEGCSFQSQLLKKSTIVSHWKELRPLPSLYNQVVRGN